MKRLRVFVFCALAASTFSSATRQEATTFQLKDEKGVNAVTYWIEDSLEPYTGFSNDVRGQVSLSLEKPEAASGKVVIGMKSLTGSNANMAESMKGGWCLDVQKYPEATFEIIKFEPTSRAADRVKGQVTGDFTVKGITKRITVPAKATLYPNMLSEREGGERKGDVLILGTEFSFDRRDYKIGTSVGPDLVGNEIKIKFHIAATRTKA